MNECVLIPVRSVSESPPALRTSVRFDSSMELHVPVVVRFALKTQPTFDAMVALLLLVINGFFLLFAYIVKVAIVYALS